MPFVITKSDEISLLEGCKLTTSQKKLHKAARSSTQRINLTFTRRKTPPYTIAVTSLTRQIYPAGKHEKIKERATIFTGIVFDKAITIILIKHKKRIVTISAK